jgi:hypothetical protein
VHSAFHQEERGSQKLCPVQRIVKLWIFPALKSPALSPALKIAPDALTLSLASKQSVCGTKNQKQCGVAIS